SSPGASPMALRTLGYLFYRASSARFSPLAPHRVFPHPSPSSCFPAWPFFLLSFANQHSDWLDDEKTKDRFLASLEMTVVSHAPLATSFRFFSQPKTASRTRPIVSCATVRAFFEPASKISSTCFGFFSYFTLRSRTGAIHLIRFSAMAALHSMQPIPAVVHPCRTHSSRPGSAAENSLCQSYTGHTSGFPGSVRLFRAGSVTITFVFA